jgi:hypothetical protein
LAAACSMQDLENTDSYDRSFPWFDKLPITGNTVLTLFGQLHIALDELVTENAVRFCAGKEVAYVDARDEQQTQVLLDSK